MTFQLQTVLSQANLHRAGEILSEVCGIARLTVSVALVDSSALLSCCSMIDGRLIVDPFDAIVDAYDSPTLELLKYMTNTTHNIVGATNTVGRQQPDRFP